MQKCLELPIGAGEFIYMLDRHFRGVQFRDIEQASVLAFNSEDFIGQLRRSEMSNDVSCETCDVVWVGKGCFFVALSEDLELS